VILYQSAAVICPSFQDTGHHAAAAASQYSSRVTRPYSTGCHLTAPLPPLLSQCTRRHSAGLNLSDQQTGMHVTKKTTPALSWCVLTCVSYKLWIAGLWSRPQCHVSEASHKLNVLSILRNRQLSLTGLSDFWYFLLTLLYGPKLHACANWVFGIVHALLVKGLTYPHLLTLHLASRHNLARYQWRQAN